jgi:transcriptional regulator with XRE-family HTH domain
METVRRDDSTDQAFANDADRAVVKAVGDELRRARACVGWSRPELVKRMKTQIPVNTYACYEQGIRQCSIPRLVEICEALGIRASELIDLALQRLERDLDRSEVLIDLHKIVRDEREELWPLRQWAQNRIKVDALTTATNEPAVVRLPWVVVKEMGVFCGTPNSLLLDYIQEFSPDSALS